MWPGCLAVTLYGSSFEAFLSGKAAEREGSGKGHGSLCITWPTNVWKPPGVGEPSGGKADKEDDKCQLEVAIWGEAVVNAS